MGQMVHREQMGINLPIEMAKWLRVKSEETGIPISRLVEKMIEPKMKEEARMKKYRIKEEHFDSWMNGFSYTDENSIIDLAEIERLSAEWEVPVKELMEQVDEI